MATPPESPKGSGLPIARLLQVAGACVLIGAIIYLMSGKGGGFKRRSSAAQTVNITLPPPPPPPPPPPKLKPPEPPPPSENTQQMVAETAAEPDPAPAAPSNDAPLGTGIKGNGGADSFGLGTGPGGGGSGGARLSGSGGGTRWAGYSGSIKNRIIDALRADERTRYADGQLELGIWMDAGGRITRVSVRRSNVDASVNKAIQGDVLLGLQTQPPPTDMPQPIWFRTTLRPSS